MCSSILVQRSWRQAAASLRSGPRMQFIQRKQCDRHGDGMNVDPQKVFEKIDVEELLKVTLDLGNIDSPTGSEGPVADYVYDWLRREGFETSKLGLYPDRPNVVATLPGTDEGRSLCF